MRVWLARAEGAFDGGIGVGSTCRPCTADGMELSKECDYVRLASEFCSHRNHSSMATLIQASTAAATVALMLPAVSFARVHHV